jgi:hypothetical protein
MNADGGETLQQSKQVLVGYCREYKMNNAFLVKAKKITGR